ncbi:tripartite motif-containing protein 72-like [Mauremys reevesii]|uniref:tripartite motif-containing protein 72-like n=1 Tax=Mauremys reevesii TaxID=260615 RepID=UPI00193FC05F|nr:tripartite motif-containing protein 72-like [Mauremys reevesii]XP_039390253.1 tripartite motif-containing protein 72-like [Mauremys reevesii]XP_039390254.1 tripartite motif-containing protein 72-like [Mauremys reevesii]XP_039390255.1 tripartite motif-containing protein 72-like [Mauremys reevesii]XP_039390256.1 tripartite motif-containing protein 72-like [Mauremys reevesii]
MAAPSNEMWPRSKAARTRPRDFPAPVKMEDLTLDRDTAHPLLEIPADGKEVRCGTSENNVSSGPKRFDTANCVVTNQSFSAGQHYWEVFVGQKRRWNLGIVSERARRQGRLIENRSGEVCTEGYWLIGYNQQKAGKPYKAFDTNPMAFECSPHPETIGVYLDYKGKEVTFYNADDPCDLIPLYSFYNAAFNDAPVYPFFDPCWHDNGGNTQTLKILQGGGCSR